MNSAESSAVPLNIMYLIMYFIHIEKRVFMCVVLFV